MNCKLQLRLFLSFCVCVTALLCATQTVSAGELLRDNDVTVSGSDSLSSDDNTNAFPESDSSISLPDLDSQEIGESVPALNESLSGSVSGSDAEGIAETPNTPSENIIVLENVVPYSTYDTYYGSISTTYLEYMRGYLSKLSSSSHYVAARTGQYEYVFAYGEDLKYNGSSFSGSAMVARWNTYNNGAFSFSYDSNFVLRPGSFLVYTDLTEEYPSLLTSSDFTLRQILILFTIFCICLTVNSMYQVHWIRRTNRRKGA